MSILPDVREAEIHPGQSVTGPTHLSPTIRGNVESPVRCSYSKIYTRFFFFFNQSTAQDGIIVLPWQVN